MVQEMVSCLYLHAEKETTLYTVISNEKMLKIEVSRWLGGTCCCAESS